MIHFVVALLPEAKPLIEFYGLRPLPKTGVFKIYECADKRLVISGIGKINSAKAAEFLHEFSASKRNHVWLNVGIAGHATRSLGEGILAHRITDAVTQKSWYPPIMTEFSLPTDSILTVERPRNHYDFLYVYEMEAAGFYDTVTRFSTAELAHCFKVISDNGESSSKKVTAKLAEDLIGNNLRAINGLVQKLAELSKRLLDVRISEQQFAKCLETWHFTVTEEHRLRRLLARLVVLGLQDVGAQFIAPNCCQSQGVMNHAPTMRKKDLFDFLEEKINSSPVML